MKTQNKKYELTEKYTYFKCENKSCGCVGAWKETKKLKKTIGRACLICGWNALNQDRVRSLKNE